MTEGGKRNSGELFSRLMARGVTQHYCIADGNLLPSVADLAMMPGCDYEEI